MPSDDLILNVRQIGNYPPTADVFPGDLIVLQRGGLGGPYQSITAQDFVATALAQGGGPLDVSTGFAPADAVPMQIFTDNLVVALGATHNWNCYFSSTTNSFAYVANAPAAAFGFNGGVGFVWGAAPPGAPGAACPITNFMSLSPTGELTLFANSLTLPRDPMLPMEAATAQWVSANTVSSFNGRTGAVTLGTWDILYAGGAPLWSPAFGGAPTAPTPEPAACGNQIATAQYVQTAIAQSIDSFLASEVFVASFNGRTGVVVLTVADVTSLALPYAPLDSPAFTGYATSLTPPPGTNDGQLATTAFVQNAVQESTTGVSSFNGRTGIVSLTAADLTGAGGALINSPTFTGSPVAPQPAPGDNSGRIATTAFVMSSVGAGFAPLNSPAFTGVPTAPTAAVATNTNQLATCAFVMSEIAAVNAGVISFNGRSGIVSLIANDISAAGGATLASPIFTGLPSAPTANPGNNTTQLATTQFVTAAIAAQPAIPLPSTTNPIVNGPATPGTSAAFARGDHVHPIDTSRAAASALAGYLPLTGGTMTGGITTTALTATGSLVASNLQINNGILSILKGTATNPALFFNDGATNRTTLYFNVATGQTTLTDSYGGGNLAMGPDGTTVLSGGGGAGNYAANSAGNMLVTPGAPGNILELVQGAPLWGAGGPWGAISDARIKTVQGDYALGLEEVLKLRPVNYLFRGNEKMAFDAPSKRADGVSHVGLVAQEVESVFPAMVEKRAGFIDDQPVSDLRTLNTGELIFALVNAVKTLAARIAALEGATS